MLYKLKICIIKFILKFNPITHAVLFLAEQWLDYAQNDILRYKLVDILHFFDAKDSLGYTEEELQYFALPLPLPFCKNLNVLNLAATSFFCYFVEVLCVDTYFCLKSPYDLRGSSQKDVYMKELGKIILKYNINICFSIYVLNEETTEIFEYVFFRHGPEDAKIEEDFFTRATKEEVDNILIYFGRFLKKHALRDVMILEEGLEKTCLVNEYKAINFFNFYKVELELKDNVQHRRVLETKMFI
jgi:hypothetical protein